MTTPDLAREVELLRRIVRLALDLDGQAGMPVLRGAILLHDDEDLHAVLERAEA